MHDGGCGNAATAVGRIHREQCDSAAIRLPAKMRRATAPGRPARRPVRRRWHPRPSDTGVESVLFDLLDAPSRRRRSPRPSTPARSAADPRIPSSLASPRRAATPGGGEAEGVTTSHSRAQFSNHGDVVGALRRCCRPPCCSDRPRLKSATGQHLRHAADFDVSFPDAPRRCPYRLHSEPAPTKVRTTLEVWLTTPMSTIWSPVKSRAVI